MIIIGATIGLIRKKNKFKQKKLTGFKAYENPAIKKEEHILKIIEKEEKGPAPSGLEPIIGFIQAGYASGDGEKNIKKALVRGGWNRKQIKQAFKGIKK